MDSININGYTRINKIKARKLYNSGEPIFLLPSKILPDSPWVQMYKLQLDEKGDSFDSSINAYEYYNCNNETGKSVHFYTYEKL